MTLPRLAKDLCSKCGHRETCKTPCRPVELHLAEDNLTVYEKSVTDEDGRTVTVVFARSREVPESQLPRVSEETDAPIDSPFTTEAANPFASFNPDLKQTGVFVRRFFEKWSFEDIGVAYDMTPENARKTYHNALRRLEKVLVALDGKDGPRDLEPWKRMVEERSGAFSKGQKWFLLNKLLGLRPSEIAEIEGVKHASQVRGMIIRVADQITCGEISLFETDPEEAQAAKERLEAQRAKRRKRYARQKATG